MFYHLQVLPVFLWNENSIDVNFVPYEKWLMVTIVKAGVLETWSINLK